MDQEGEKKEKESKSNSPGVVYSTGCRDLDERVWQLGTTTTTTTTTTSLLSPGHIVGISADGDIGLAVALQVIVRHLRTDTAATARVVTTYPAAHVAQLLRAVEKAEAKGARETTTEVEAPSRADVLRRVLVSRIYTPDDLWAVLTELEAAVPFRRLWSAEWAETETTETSETTENETKADPPPAIMVFTEMDHHFKWMRLQGDSRGLRLHELYGQLVRRLRGLAVAGGDPAASASASASTSTARQSLILVLNSTAVQQPSWTGDHAGEVADETAGNVEEVLDEEHQDHEDKMPRPADKRSELELAVALLQQLPEDITAEQRADVTRLCYREMARTQNIGPRYKNFMDYLCSLHVCFTPVGEPTALWVATVEHDETEMYCRSHNRFGLVQFAHGVLRDVLFPA